MKDKRGKIRDITEKYWEGKDATGSPFTLRNKLS